MVSFSKIACLAAASGGVLAAPSTANHGPLVKFSELKQLPNFWTAKGRVEEGTITARIGLKQNNIKGLQDKLMDIAHPNSPNYGKWMSKEEVDAYTAPDATHVAAVKAWLASAGVTEVEQPTNDWLKFTVPVSKMEELLDTKYEWYTHEQTGETLPRTKQFSIPEKLHDMIDIVTPTNVFYQNLAPEQAESDPHSLKARALSTPDYINKQYHIDYNSTGSQTMAVTGFLDVGASHEDYAQFLAYYNISGNDFVDVDAGNKNNDDGSQAEGNLDTQYGCVISQAGTCQYIDGPPGGRTSDKDFDDALLAVSTYLNGLDKPPSSISTSYGGEERSNPPEYMDRVCNEYMKNGARGISVFLSSGDNGVGGNGGNDCNGGKYYATWPAACPYITSVGGTQFNDRTEVVADFRAATGLTSPGGGYSEHFDAPDYNKKVTTAYANSLSASQQRMFDGTKRGFPDVSLLSVNYEVVVGGSIGTYLGTSASSPVVAGMVSLLNDYLESNGKPRLGFINPLLYSGKVDVAINDITSGKNLGCNTNGFSATRGWDAASGLGSVDFAKLRAAL